jgi:conjugative transfer signal peptidase TraF
VAWTSRVLEKRDEGGPTPAPSLGNSRLQHRTVLQRAALVGLGIGVLLGTIAHPPKVRLLWNASASAPIGLYLIKPGAALEVGDMVAAWAPEGARQLAARRGYLPSGVPLVKRVEAIEGSRVCAVQARILVDERVSALRKKRDARGRLMPWWTGCRRLQPGQVLLLNRVKASFDSRYFGPVERAAILGKAVLIWPR